MMLRLLRYSIAVPNELVQYRARSTPLYQSRLPRPQSNVPLWPRLGSKKCHRSFGGDRARKLAGGDPEVGDGHIKIAICGDHRERLVCLHGTGELGLTRANDLKVRFRTKLGGQPRRHAIHQRQRVEERVQV